MTVKTMELLRYLYAELGERSGRIDYEKAGKKIGMTYQGVRYAVGRLKKAGFIKIEDKEITVLQCGII